MISHKKKLIFIHIPKNAGTSIIKAIGEDKIIDKSIEQYKEHYKKYWNDYKKFTVVRDPIDRFVSAYKFARMGESELFSLVGRKGLEKHPHYDFCNSMCINEYVSFIYNNPKKINYWIIPQTFFILNKNKKIEIDYIARYENLLEDLKKIGIDNIQKLNASEIDNDNLIQLTKRSKQLLHEIYDIDYQNFSYSKDLKNFFSYS